MTALDLPTGLTPAEEAAYRAGLLAALDAARRVQNEYAKMPEGDRYYGWSELADGAGYAADAILAMIDGPPITPVDDPSLLPHDPMERIIAEALRRRRTDFTRDPHPECHRLDFYLRTPQVHVEVKQFHTDRVAEQMSRVPNVIVAQGFRAVSFLAALLAPDSPDEKEAE